MTTAYRWNCASAEVTWLPRDRAQLVSFREKLFILGGWSQDAGERPDLSKYTLFSRDLGVPGQSRDNTSGIPGPPLSRSG